MNSLLDLAAKALLDGRFGVEMALSQPTEGVSFLHPDDEVSSISTPLCYCEGTLFLTFALYMKKRLFKWSRETFPKEKLELQIPEGLYPEQQALFSSISFSRKILLSGGPGSGKSHTLCLFIPAYYQAFLELYGKEPKIAIAAPTGKAAFHLYSRLSSFFKEKVFSSTLHSLVKMEKKALDLDLLIIDEASMIDLNLFSHLIDAFGSNGDLILVGDPNQLPSIDGGAPFRALIEEGCLPHLKLSKTLRTENSHLIEESKALLNGTLPKGTSLAEFRLEEWLPLFPQKSDNPSYSVSSSFRILSSFRKGFFGAIEINQRIYQALRSKPGRYLPIPILITSNRAEMELFNGQEGILLFDDHSPLHKVYFPHLKEPIYSHLLPPYEMGYALSIHKSQGSEYDSILLLIPQEEISIPLLYTGMTRAKRDYRIYW